MDDERRNKSKKAIEKKTKTKKKQEESIAKLELDFGNFLKDKSEETGFSETDIVNAMINSQFAVIEFDETVGKASLVFNNWQVPTTVIPENQPISAKIISEFRDLRDNFAPVSAGVEWHLGFTIGGGFEVNIADLTDKHQREMQEEIIKWCKTVHQDEYLIGLKSILEIMEDTALTDGCSAAEILYEVETRFEDYIEGYEPIEVPDLKDPKKKRIVQVPIMREPNWNKKLNDEDMSPILGGITRLKIIEDAVNRLRPYRHPKSGRILFWTLDEKIQDPWATKEIINQSPTKFHPWEIFWKTGNRRGTNLKARSIIQPVYSIAKFLQSIQNAVGVGFNRWANKKYFFVCGSEKRTWGKKHLDEFLKSMELMIKKNWVGIPVPYGFEIKEIGGEQSIFEGKNLLDHLTGMICFAPKTPILANPEFKNIEELKVGDKVLTQDGTFQPILEIMNRQINEELIVLQPHYSPSIKVTSNHPIRIYDGTEHWKRAEDIQKTDYVVFPRPKLDAYTNPFKYPLTIDFLEFLGYYIGDGHISKDSWIYITLNKTETEKLQRLTEIVIKMGWYHYSVHERLNGNVINFGVRNEELARQLKEFCKFPSHNKQIPEQIMGMSQEQFNALWKGLIASDGHVRPKGQEFFVSTSRKLIGQIYLLMAKFGIVPYIRHIESQVTKFSERKGGQEVWSRESWQLITYYPKPQQWTIVKEDKIYIPMMKIGRERYNGIVHNFAVANNETYTTFGCLVHNCAGMNFPREFLEVGRTQAGDKSWLAWTVRYGRNQQYLKDAVEQQLWQRHLWCKFGKEHRISKKGVKVDEQKMEPIFVPLMEWKAEGQWLKSQKMKELKSVLDAANPADPPMKIKVEKEMAKVLGLGEIDFSQIEELLDIQTRSRIMEAKMEMLKSEAKLEKIEDAKEKGKLAEFVAGEEEKAREKTTEEELEERQKKRLRGGVSRTARDKETQKGKARDVGGTRQPSLEETVGIQTFIESTMMKFKDGIVNEIRDEKKKSDSLEEKRKEEVTAEIQKMVGETMKKMKDEIVDEVHNSLKLKVEKEKIAILEEKRKQQKTLSDEIENITNRKKKDDK